MFNKKDINICLSCDDNYVKYAGVTIASAIYNNKNTAFLNVYILDGNISNINKIKLKKLENPKFCSINFIKVNEQDFNSYKNLNTHKYVTLQTYYRLKLGRLLPFVNKIIYFDCDMIINSNLLELYNVELGNNFIGAVLDARVYHKRKWRNSNYVNAGMILFDLEKIRKENIENLFEQYAQINFDKIQTGDQDIINFVLKDKIKILDNKWNVQVSGFASRTSFTNHPKVVHYIGSDKPWIYASNTYFKELYFKYLQCTPWALNKEEKEKWEVKNKKDSTKKFWKNRWYCIISPKYWYACCRSFLKC